MTDALAWLSELPAPLIYVGLSLGAAIENVVPAIPADTFVVLGGFLSGMGGLDPLVIALGTWTANVLGALMVWRLSLTHGPAFFERGVGRFVMRPHQMERLAGFYERWGTTAIFFSRFLPGVRAVVPVFAGATDQRGARVVVPIAVASAIWYGGLVYLGVWAGTNLDLLAAAFRRLNTTVGWVAVGVGVICAVAWFYTRREPDDG